MELHLSKFQGSKKTVFMIISVLLLAFVFAYFVPSLTGMDTAEATSLKSKVSSNNTTTLTKTVDDAGNTVVKLARDIAVVVLILLLIWMGYSVWFKKTAEGLADMKGRLFGALIAIVFVFMPEKILGVIFKMFGITLT